MKTGQHATQLDVLRTAVVGPLDELRGTIAGSPDRDTQTPEAVYAACRASDTRTEFVRRVLTYYQGKLDQRNDTSLARVFSGPRTKWCGVAGPSHSVMRATPIRTVTMRPAPLPYIESQYSPAAVPREDPPLDLRGRAG